VRKLYGIQCLRALAAIAVVAFHALGRWRYDFNVGQAGVDVFFVISGYIMWTVAGPQTTPATFMKDRIVRIVPLYWIATAAIIAGGLAHIFPNLHLSLGHIILSLLFVPYVDASGHLWPVLVQGWTLNYELFFYIIFASLLILPKPLRMIALTVCFSALAISGAVVAPAPPFARFYTDPIIVEFLLGSLIAYGFSRWRPGRAAAVALMVLGAGGFAACGLNLIAGPRLLVFGAPAAFLVAGVVAAEGSGLSFNVRALAFLGDASYSIYLFHTFAVSIAARLIPSGAGLLGPLAGTLLGVAFGCAAHGLVERPLMRRLRKKRSAVSLNAVEAPAAAAHDVVQPS